MNQLVRFDTASLNRALIGFDTMFDDLEKRFANQIQTSYPPHNIVKLDDDNYEIQIAVTGFNPADVSVEVNQNQLIVKGEHVEVETEETQYLHRGLAARNFTRSWTLAEHMEVGQGRIKNGVLTVALKRVIPEALKPRQVKLIAE
jgi:molecular chaperone IbpA